MRYLILIGTLTLAGCGQLNTFVTANQAAVIRDAQTANDNMVHGIEAASCAVPIGAVIRNPEFIPIAEAACMPAGTQSNPVSMFQSMQTNPVTVPAYEVPSTTQASATQPQVTAPQKPITAPKSHVLRKNTQVISPKAVVSAPAQTPAVQPVAPSPASPVPFGTLPSGALP